MSKPPASAPLDSCPRVWILHRARSRVPAVHDVCEESLRTLYRERGVQPSVERYWLQDRPGESSITLSELLNAIEEKRCDVIVLEDTTRLSRKPSEALRIMMPRSATGC